MRLLLIVGRVRYMQGLCREQKHSAANVIVRYLLAGAQSFHSSR